MEDSGNTETDCRCPQWPQRRSPLAGDLRRRECDQVARKRAPRALEVRWQEKGFGISDAMD
jgi:hypothetical protein